MQDQDYEIMIDREKIKLLKKKNNFKLKLNFIIDEKKNDIIKKFQSNEIFKLLKSLNEDIIEDIKIDNSNRIIILLNIFENNDDENKKYYLSFTTEIVNKDKFNINIIGLKNSEEFIKDNYQKIELEKIEFKLNHNINDNSINISIKIKYNSNLLLAYLENYVGKLFLKIFKKLINYYE